MMIFIRFVALTTLIFSTSSSYAMSEVCKSAFDHWKPAGATEPASFCELTWDQDGKTVGMVYITLKNKCIRLEGDQPGDCGFVISCEEKPEDSLLSIGIFNDQSMTTTACRSSEDPLLLIGDPTSIPKLNYSSSLTCQNEQLHQVLLTSPSGEVKKCSLGL